MSAELGKWSWACVHAESLYSLLKAEHPGGKEFPTTSLNIPGVNWELGGSTQTQQPLPFLQEPARAACIYRQKPVFFQHFIFEKNVEIWSLTSLLQQRKVKSAAEGWILTMRSDHQNGLNWKPGVSLSKLQHTQEHVQQVSSFPLFPLIPIFFSIVRNLCLSEVALRWRRIQY